MYVRAHALEHSVTKIVHHFLDVDTVAYKLQPGGHGYELVYGTTGVIQYLLSLTPKNDLRATFDAIAAHEQTLLHPLISFLVDPVQKERGVRIVGEETVNLERVPTVSFVVTGQRPLKSRTIVDFFDKKGGVRNFCCIFPCPVILTGFFFVDWDPLWPFLRLYIGGQACSKIRHR